MEGNLNRRIYEAREHKRAQENNDNAHAQPIDCNTKINDRTFDHFVLVLWSLKPKTCSFTKERTNAFISCLIILNSVLNIC